MIGQIKRNLLPLVGTSVSSTLNALLRFSVSHTSHQSLDGKTDGESDLQKRPSNGFPSKKPAVLSAGRMVDLNTLSESFASLVSSSESEPRNFLNSLDAFAFNVSSFGESNVLAEEFASFNPWLDNWSVDCSKLVDLGSSPVVFTCG